MKKKLILTVNGELVRVVVKQNETLLDVLRNHLHLKSVKAACWRGDCGLCTVLVNDTPMKSCLILALEMENQEITTIEGFNKSGLLSPVQKSFIDHGAVQCGFCTPAFILTAEALLKRNPKPSREDILEEFNGIICRCTGYEQIVQAVLKASDQ
ncbi:MAG: (2Fe-2S)-binding protein [Candidatus Hodarchaeales archaeon]|jgi:carbon-monoxide dehydrogenase small subunit